jgi:CTP synthase (UTP-ammonia lyase)
MCSRHLKVSKEYNQERKMQQQVRVGIIGDYSPDVRFHVATTEALKHAAKALSVAVESQWLPTQSLADERPLETMKHFDALWCSPGSPYKSMNGALRGVRFAREMGVPFIGT